MVTRLDQALDSEGEKLLFRLLYGFEQRGIRV